MPQIYLLVGRSENKRIVDWRVRRSGNRSLGCIGGVAVSHTFQQLETGKTPQFLPCLGTYHPQEIHVCTQVEVAVGHIDIYNFSFGAHVLPALIRIVFL